MGLFSAPSSKSGNKAWGFIKDTYSPQAQGGVAAFNNFGNLLGMNGEPANREAYDNFLNNSGFDWIMDDAMQGVTNSAAGKFMLRSGATGKALQDRATNIGKTFFDNYLDRVGQMSAMGLGAGNLMANAGQYSKQKGGGMGGQLLGAGLSAAASAGLFSDEALKDNVTELGYDIGGVPAISFTYRQDKGIDLPEGEFIGVRAQDVARLRPDALGPIRDGYMTVNYGAL